ncbi:MAG: hypothetical protein MJB12_02270 [Firmicutes bacterium]|nr:hypothetical protein [Bacillota bacterium]
MKIIPSKYIIAPILALLLIVTGAGLVIASSSAKSYDGCQTISSIAGNNAENNQNISKEEVIAWINEQSDNKLEYYDEFVYEVINLDNDPELEIAAKNITGVHLGTFYIFDYYEGGKYKLIAEENWHVDSWDFSEPILIDDKKIYQLVNRSGGTGTSIFTANLWYIEKGKFVKAWEGILKHRTVFKDDYFLEMGSYQFNDDNNLMYVWLSSYIYELDGVTLKEKVSDDIEVFEFDGTQFTLLSQAKSDSTIQSQYNYFWDKPGDNIDIEKVERVISNDSNSVFKGKIGTKKICMAIYRNEEQLTASYITPNEDDGEINLQGTIQINTASFILYNEDNDIFFTGKIKPNTLKGERLEGIYTSPKNEAGTPFSLVLTYGIGKTFETRYPLTTANTEDVEEFARKIKRYIIKDNKEGLAELIHYPIHVTINDSEVSINNAKEFKQNYDDIINADFKVRISNSYTKYMNSNYRGIMLELGMIWFDNWDNKGLRIIAINN